MTFLWIVRLVMLPNWEVAALVSLGILGIVLGLALRRLIHDATLPMVWAWGMFAWCSLTAAEVGASLSGGAAWSNAVRYAAIGTTFCPMMAVLGAKRPHHGAWNFVVLSLLIVLTLPAAESLILGREIQVHVARSWFVSGLIVLGLANWLPTRFVIPAALIAAGQTLSYLEYLPLIASQPNTASRTLELTSFVAAALIAFTRNSTSAQSDPLNRIWLDFRDLFGALWALRVMERVNAVCTSNQWPLQLNWSGFDEAALSALNHTSRRSILQTMFTIMRRFVSPEWLRQRGVSTDEDLLDCQ